MEDPLQRLFREISGRAIRPNEDEEDEPLPIVERKH
jgi:hypothetical protein